MHGEISLGLNCLGRFYNWNSTSNWNFNARYVNNNGNNTNTNLANWNSGRMNENNNSYALRPSNFYKLWKYNKILYLRNIEID